MTHYKFFQLQSPSVSYGDLKELEKYGDRPVVDNKAAIFGSITRVGVRYMSPVLNYSTYHYLDIGEISQALFCY